MLYSLSVGPKNFSRLLGEQQEKRHRENLFINNFLRSTAALLGVAIKFWIHILTKLSNEKEEDFQFVSQNLFSLTPLPTYQTASVS